MKIAHLPANSRSKIGEPADLIGRPAGLAEYQLTANVWSRGMLPGRYGLPARSAADPAPILGDPVLFPR
jgi:hypothetical protein